MTDKRVLIVAEDLKMRLEAPAWVAVDCRYAHADPGAGRRSYEERHIPGAVFLDLDEDLAGPVTTESGRHPLPDVHTISTALSALGIGHSSKVVVYDSDNGSIAARAWWLLRWLGLNDVRVLDGGFSRWCALGLPTSAALPRRPAQDFTPAVRSERVLTTDELALKVASGHSLRLLDAREAVRFRGEQEPIDPVAGHVPGAQNLWFGRFVHPDGTWLPLAQRSALLRDVLGNEPDRPWSVMCGSGVTACHLAISAFEAGFREPRLYVGSWSEWIRDPGRPIGAGER